MTSILLLGDSLRLHYQVVVEEMLGPGVAVSGPAENCRDSRTLLDHLEPWALSRTADIVHVNCGLHDLRHDPGADGPVVPLAAYRANVIRLLSLLRQRVTEHVIWATSTPIDELRHNATRPGRRYAADVVAYNAVAVEEATRLRVPINDLYAAVMDEGPAGLLKADGIHFTDDGYRFLGERVARSISSMLPGKEPGTRRETPLGRRPFGR